MEQSVHAQGDVQVVTITGSLDALTAPELGDTLSTQLKSGNAKLVADVAGLDYTSSAGLRVLLNSVKEARQKGGDLRLAAVQPNVDKVLELSGFKTIIKTFPDVASAVSSFS